MDHPLPDGHMKKISQMAKTRIMIVEDEVVVSADLRNKVLQLGYHVCPVVRYGEKVLDAVRREVPELILMDIKLKGEMTGIEAAERVKGHLDIPIVFVTAYSDNETLNRAKISHLFGFLKKPVRADDLRINIEMALYKADLARRLRESEEKYRFLAEHSADVIYRLNISTEQYVYTSPSVSAMLGYSKEDILSLKAGDTVTPESYHKQLNKLAEDMAAGGRAPRIMELEALHKDGHTVPVEVHASLIFDDKGTPVEIMGIVRDITERKKAEAERTLLETRLQEARKLEAVSTLAGGIAHEFNNALTGVMGNLELMRMDLPDQSAWMKRLEAMDMSAARMSRLTDQLLAYARGGKYDAKNMKFDDFIRETLPILRHSLRPDLSIETYFQEDIPYVRADVTQMQMVLAQVLINASEAMDGAGKVRILTEHIVADGEFRNRHPALESGSHVCLTVKDDGRGMNEEAEKKIFDPFFTTKFQGRGMGMAAAHGIVANHGGWITAASESGKGTVIRIYLPAVEIEEKGRKEPPPTKTAKRAGTILVIEDEELVMGTVQVMLERIGHQTITAKTGKDALRLAEISGGDIDLVLLDMKLSDMDGLNLYRRLMKIRPHLKVLVCGGYAMGGPAQAILDAGAQGFIQKPFTVAALSLKLKAVLAKE